MKWTHCLIILLVASGTLADLDVDVDRNEEGEDDFDIERHSACREQEREECFKEPPPKEFPKNAEELLTMCHAVIRKGRCILKVRENCSQDEEEYIYKRHISDYLDTVCQEENPVFQEIVSHLECITESIQKSWMACRPQLYRDEDNDFALTGQVASFVEKSLFLNEDNIYCVDAVFIAACPAIAVGLRCGDRARDAVYEVLINADDYAVRCGEEVLTELEPILDVFEELIKEKVFSENDIDKK